MPNPPISLKQILALVGSLDDAPGDQTPRERFRQFLQENVTEVGQLRDYIEECLRTSGDQYSRALQDLVNRLGQFLGFQVRYGRYQGVAGQIGFDGLWDSPKGYHIVVEVKTSEVYAVRTATLVGYIDNLISERRIPSWEDALGLYVVGRPDREIRQLENAIVAEKRTHALRVVSVESLLSLAELLREYDVSHEDILAVLRPASPRIDSVVDLLSRLAAGPRPGDLAGAADLASPHPSSAEQVATSDTDSNREEVCYWLTSVRSNEQATAAEIIRALVGQHQVYAFGDHTPGRQRIKPDDWIAFYEKGNGVVGHARVASKPVNQAHPKVHHPELYHWTFHVKGALLYLDDPLVIDAEMRAQLDDFKNRDPNASWAWFVQATRRLSAHDFALLTRQRA